MLFPLFSLLSSLLLQEPLVISTEDTNKNSQIAVGTMVDCMYGRKSYRARITKVWGHELFDVRYVNPSG